MTNETQATQQVLDALQRLRDAENAMHERARTTSAMSENELRIVRFLLTENTAGHAVTPTHLARHLGVTSASMTALLDRLERAGAIERVRHPSDRRSLVIVATPLAEQTVGAPVVAFQEATHEIIARLSPDERESALSLLKQLTDAANDASRLTAVSA